MSDAWVDKNTRIYEMDIADEFDMSFMDETIDVVARRMQQLGDGGVIFVAEEEGQVNGYITAQDIVNLVAEGYSPSEVEANQIMNDDFMEVLSEETLGGVLPMIAEKYPNAIVVTDYDRKCVGYFSKNDYKDALAGLGCYDKSRDPITPEEWLTKGIAMSSMGNTSEALQCYEKFLATHPRPERAWFELARKFEKDGRGRDACICYDKYVSINPHDMDGWYNRGNILSQLRNHTQAVQSYQKALKIEPNNVNVLRNMGLTLSDMGKGDMAISVFKKAEAVSGETDDLCYKKGNVHDKMGNTKKAIKCYERAVDLNPGNEEAWFNLGAALHSINKSKKALRCFEEVLRLNPGNESAREALTICREQKRFGLF